MSDPDSELKLVKSVSYIAVIFKVISRKVIKMFLMFWRKEPVYHAFSRTLWVHAYKLNLMLCIVCFVHSKKAIEGQPERHSIFCCLLKIQYFIVTNEIFCKKPEIFHTKNCVMFVLPLF